MVTSGAPQHSRDIESLPFWERACLLTNWTSVKYHQFETLTGHFINFCQTTLSRSNVTESIQFNGRTKCSSKCPIQRLLCVIVFKL
jgi:hypothetical protein